MRKKHETIIHKVLHIIERVIAFITLGIMLFMLGLEIYKIFTTAEYFATMDTFLNNILTIVVGLEFVRMLIDMTPANTIEVLIVAIARQVILTHNNPWANLASIICIAGLFATRHFLIPKEELTVELSEVE
jgi:uncharacterized membrane protein (DUF373 family)